MADRRCNGTKRYALRCRNHTTDPSGLCYAHRHQEWADIRTPQGADLAGLREQAPAAVRIRPGVLYTSEATDG